MSSGNVFANWTNVQHSKTYSQKRRDRPRPVFDFNTRRRREIERHAIAVRAFDSEDFERWQIAWLWHLPKSKDPAGALTFASRRMGRSITLADAEALVEATRPRKIKADDLAKLLGVTYAQRKALGIKTIGACDITKRARKELRKRDDRERKAKARRAAGAKPHSQSLARTAPWLAEGISRRTWFRRRGTNSSATVSFFTADETVPPARPGTEYHPQTEQAARSRGLSEDDLILLAWPT
jgi:hypothetical protein